jgi:hypothetical protein
VTASLSVKPGSLYPRYSLNALIDAATASDAKPKLWYAVGRAAARVSLARRIAPARAFDKQIRKLNRMAK